MISRPLNFIFSGSLQELVLSEIDSLPEDFVMLPDYLWGSTETAVFRHVRDVSWDLEILIVCEITQSDSLKVFHVLRTRSPLDDDQGTSLEHLTGRGESNDLGPYFIDDEEFRDGMRRQLEENSGLAGSLQALLPKFEKRFFDFMLFLITGEVRQNLVNKFAGAFSMSIEMDPEQLIKEVRARMRELRLSHSISEGDYYDYYMVFRGHGFELKLSAGNYSGERVKNPVPRQISRAFREQCLLWVDNANQFNSLTRRVGLYIVVLILRYPITRLEVGVRVDVGEDAEAIAFIQRLDSHLGEITKNFIGLVFPDKLGEMQPVLDS